MLRSLVYEQVNIDFLHHSAEVTDYSYKVINTNTNYDVMKMLSILNSENHKSYLNLSFSTKSIN